MRSSPRGGAPVSTAPQPGADREGSEDPRPEICFAHPHRRAVCRTSRRRTHSPSRAGSVLANADGVYATIAVDLLWEMWSLCLRTVTFNFRAKHDDGRMYRRAPDGEQSCSRRTAPRSCGALTNWRNAREERPRTDRCVCPASLAGCCEHRRVHDLIDTSTRHGTRLDGGISLRFSVLGTVARF